MLDGALPRGGGPRGATSPARRRDDARCNMAHRSTAGRRVGVADDPFDDGARPVELHSRTIEAPPEVAEAATRGSAGEAGKLPIPDEGLRGRGILSSGAGCGPPHRRRVRRGLRGGPRSAGARLDDGRSRSSPRTRTRAGSGRAGPPPLRPHLRPLRRASDRSGPAAGAAARGAEGRTTVLAFEARSGSPTHPSGAARDVEKLARPRSCSGRRRRPGRGGASARCRRPTPTPASGC